MCPDQAEQLRDDWVQQRAANPGYPAVLSGGLKWTPTALNPKDMALLELAQFTNSADRGAVGGAAAPGGACRPPASR